MALDALLMDQQLPIGAGSITAPASPSLALTANRSNAVRLLSNIIRCIRTEAMAYSFNQTLQGALGKHDSIIAPSSRSASQALRLLILVVVGKQIKALSRIISYGHPRAHFRPYALDSKAYASASESALEPTRYSSRSSTAVEMFTSLVFVLLMVYSFNVGSKRSNGRVH